MTSSTEALAAIRADLANACVPNPETLRVIRAVPKLLAIAEAATGARCVTKGADHCGRCFGCKIQAALASLTSEETPAPTPTDPYADCPVYVEHGACHCSTGVGGACAKPLSEVAGYAAAAAPDESSVRTIHGPCECRARCGDVDNEIGACKRLPAPPETPLIEVTTVIREDFLARTDAGEPDGV